MALDVRDMQLLRGTAEDSFALGIARLSLLPGQAVVLHGASGLGKSTCLELLAGVVRPDSAKLFTLTRANGQVVNMAQPALDTAPLRARDIGFGPQSGGLLGFLDARSNARAAIDLTGRRADAQLMLRFERLAAALGLQDCLGKHRSALSGGQRKRVSLLRALAVPRRLLLLDEPTAGLDDPLADRTTDCIMRTCRAEGTVCIAAMHDVARGTAFGMIPLALTAVPGGAELRMPEKVPA